MRLAELICAAAGKIKADKTYSAAQNEKNGLRARTEAVWKCFSDLDYFSTMRTLTFWKLSWTPLRAKLSRTRSFMPKNTSQ